ncbi:MAG TPA: cell division protein FtsA [Bacteroidales bacterium]|nr:cell division protein FtsA [Bacteroidales bacterium]HPT02756.1 cell division protein FtsA [Bacteroidales bacterium]
MESDIIVGLDIGTTKIAVIVGRRNELGKIEILGHGRTESIGVHRGLITNISETVQSIQRAVAEAEQRSGVTIKTVNVGIAGQHIRSIQHKGYIIRRNPEAEITEEELDNLTNSMYNLAMNPGEKIIDVIPQEYTVDGESGIKEPKGMMGHQLEANFHIITGQMTAAMNIRKCVERAGYFVENMILEPLASAESVLSEDEKEAGVVLVDIGGGTTDIAIYLDGIIRHTAVVPFGGEIITEDIKTGCAIMKKHAEDLKVKFGSTLARENRNEEVVAIPGLRGRPPKEITLRNLANIIQARMEEIIEYVYSEIKNTGLEKRLIGGIVITGGGALLKHTEQLTAFITGLDTRIGYPNEHLASNSSDEITSPMYATGVGLVMLGMQRNERSRKLTPEEPEAVDQDKKKTKKGVKKTDSQKSWNRGKGFIDWFKDFFDDGSLS